MNVDIKRLLSGLTQTELLNLLAVISQLLNKTTSSSDDYDRQVGHCYCDSIPTKDYSQYESV